MFRPRIPRIPRIGRIGRPIQPFRRPIHSLPLLPDEFANGIPGLFSPAAVDIAWTQYQSAMIQKLNALTVGSDDYNKNIMDIIVKYARDPTHATFFNHASMAHNNEFFFRALSGNPREISTSLAKELTDSFGSMETLKTEMVLTACSMFGPGFVWLVKDRNKKYTVLNTYLAGSPYPRAHYRRQPVDMNTEQKTPGEAAAARMAREPHVNSVGVVGDLSRDQQMALGGMDLMPVLCINMWEHCYLVDYVYDKQRYAESWWDSIDWDVVSERAQTNALNREFIR